MSEFSFIGKGVEIYTWENCPYCQRAKNIMNGTDAECCLENGEYVEFIEHKIDGNAQEREDMVRRCEGHSTVPQILIDGELVGGCFDLVAMIDTGTFREKFTKYIRRR